MRKKNEQPIASQINWPHVALVAIAIGGLLGALAIVLSLTPPSLLEKLLELNWPAVIVGVVSLLLTVYTMLRRAGVLHGDPAPATGLERPPELDDDGDRDDTAPAPDDTTQRFGREKRRGAATPTAMTLVLLGSIIVAIACLTGCGATAIQRQASAATIATVALEGAHRIAIDGAREDLATCGDSDEACTFEAEHRWAPIGLVHDATRAALAAWIEALEVARIAGDGGDVWPALAVAAARVLTQWGLLVAALRPLGHVLPSLPPAVVAAAGAIGGP